MRVVLDKENVKTMYLEGYNAKEISKKLKSNLDTVRTCIKRNFKELKRQHELAVIRRKENIKAINYESKKCMSDKSFIIKNRSVYSTKPNGDIVLKKDAALITTWDTPKRLTNENKQINC
ncbi:DNA-binding response regulator [Clostridium gasigenes]|uniref:DNA-binding response regulator n=1 Tax=Clostridium gasigenes TaxID=94869 RepID=UPI001629C2EA|nr:DNA-binding response regulator [Clostridium gasigenes]MBB6622554.1 DNA-binding response regulator [Clostridium gasigenes]